MITLGAMKLFLQPRNLGILECPLLLLQSPRWSPSHILSFLDILLGIRVMKKKKKTLRQLDVCSVSCLDMCWISASRFNHWKNTYTTKNFFTQFLNFWSSYSVGNGRNVISGYLLSLICGCLCWGEWLNAKILGWTGGKSWSLPVLGSA